MWNALGRQILFSAIILAIEVPLGIFVALNMPKKGFWASLCLVLMALPLLIPLNVVGTIWQIFGRVDIGLLGRTLAGARASTTTTRSDADRRLGHHHRHGRLALDLAGRAPGLCRRCSRSPTPTTRPPSIDQASRWTVFRYIELPKMRGVLRDRDPAALHGQLHDLHRALRGHRRRSRQRDDLPVASTS